ncbi:hypothetical protein FOZ63_025692, partial [Perkinsus olseni]
MWRSSGTSNDFRDKDLSEGIESASWKTPAEHDMFNAGGNRFDNQGSDGTWYADPRQGDWQSPQQSQSHSWWWDGSDNQWYTSNGDQSWWDYVGASSSTPQWSPLDRASASAGGPTYGNQTSWHAVDGRGGNSCWWDGTASESYGGNDNGGQALWGCARAASSKHPDRESESDGGPTYAIHHPWMQTGEWKPVGHTNLPEDPLLYCIKDLRPNKIDYPRLVGKEHGDSISAMLNLEKTTNSGDPTGFATLRCAEHDSCEVRFRVLLEKCPQRLRVFRNSKSHSSIKRGSEGSSFKKIRLPDAVRHQIITGYQHDPRLMPTTVYDNHLAPTPTNVPTGEEEGEKLERRRLMKHGAYLKRTALKEAPAERIEDISEFVAAFEDYRWSAQNWEDALQLLQDSKSLAPGAVLLNDVITDEFYSVSMAPCAGVESCYHLQRDLHSFGGGATIYVDGQASTIRGQQCTLYTTVVGHISESSDPQGRGFRTSLVPLCFSLVNSENKKALMAVFTAVKELFRATGNLTRVATLVCDASRATVLAARSVFSQHLDIRQMSESLPTDCSMSEPFTIHRCRWHRQEATKRSKLSREDQPLVQQITKDLQACPSREVHDALLQCVVDDEKYSAKLKAYLRSSCNIDALGTPFVSPMSDGFFIVTRLDNNLSESINSIFTRAGINRARLNSGKQVRDFLLKQCTNVDAARARALFTPTSKTRLGPTRRSIQEADQRGDSEVYVTECGREYYIADKGRRVRLLTDDDIVRWRRRDYTTYDEWKANVLSIYKVSWVVSPRKEGFKALVCSCTTFAESWQCSHICMVENYENQLLKDMYDLPSSDSRPSSPPHSMNPPGYQHENSGNVTITTEGARLVVTGTSGGRHPSELGSKSCVPSSKSAVGSMSDISGAGPRQAQACT